MDMLELARVRAAECAENPASYCVFALSLLLFGDCSNSSSVIRARSCSSTRGDRFLARVTGRMAPFRSHAQCVDAHSPCVCPW